MTRTLAHLARVALAAAGVGLVTSCGGDADGPGIVPTKDWTVTVTGGAGNGRVTSSPTGIDCRIATTATSGTCSSSFKNGTPVTLTATADPDQVFQAWGGDCTGTTCQLTVTRSVSVSAGFVRKTATLSLDFKTTATDDGAAIIAITGPPIIDLKPTSGLQLAQRARTSDGKTVVLIRGDLTNGVVATVSVSGLDAEKTFNAVVEQVAARQSGNYAQRTTLGSYSASIK